MSSVGRMEMTDEQKQAHLERIKNVFMQFDPKTTNTITILGKNSRFWHFKLTDDNGEWKITNNGVELQASNFDDKNDIDSQFLESIAIKEKTE